MIIPVWMVDMVIHLDATGWSLLVVFASWKSDASNEWYRNLPAFSWKEHIWNIIFLNIIHQYLRLYCKVLLTNSSIWSFLVWPCHLFAHQPTRWPMRINLWELWPMITTTFFTSSMMFHFLDSGLTDPKIFPSKIQLCKCTCTKIPSFSPHRNPRTVVIHSEFVVLKTHKEHLRNSAWVHPKVSRSSTSLFRNTSEKRASCS